MHLTCIEAEKLYLRDPKIKPEDVKILQEWLKKQPHLPNLEESQVIIFLHSCYYSIQATKKTIDCYFTRRTLRRELFNLPTEDTIRKAFSVGFKKILPRKTPQGYAVMISGLVDHRPDRYIFNNEVLLLNLLYSLHIFQQGFSDGIVGIIDFQGGTLGHLARVNLSTQKFMIDHLQEGIPIRLKSIHMVNTPSFMDKIMAILKPLMSSKLFEMIQVHSTLDTLYKYVPKECLPEDYGGELPSRQMMQEETLKEVFDNLDFFRWHDSQVVDESKRIGQPNITQSTFGVEGTFKKLAID
ncbi:hypothetical protein Zmor_008070 [Zophobas morio]|uniref:CRAL-TRIO domain-containing protein n=1 Tax=Zophobas morio TaxID=2755281 RepID=A0AA38MQ54_9CUCU|nr:hypothetical protein Zmor_008070 [Zophobas morio]